MAISVSTIGTGMATPITTLPIGQIMPALAKELMTSIFSPLIMSWFAIRAPTLKSSLKTKTSHLQLSPESTVYPSMEYTKLAPPRLQADWSIKLSGLDLLRPMKPVELSLWRKQL